MKLKYRFEFMELDGEIMAVPSENNEGAFHGVLKINESAKRMLELLSEETTAQSVIDTLCDEHKETDAGIIKEAVNEFIGQLRANKLLSE